MAANKFSKVAGNNWGKMSADHAQNIATAEGQPLAPVWTEKQLWQLTRATNRRYWRQRLVSLKAEVEGANGGKEHEQTIASD